MSCAVLLSSAPMKVSVLSLLGQVRRTLFIFQSLLDSVTPPLSDANGRERYRVLGTEGGFIFDRERGV